MIRQRPSTQALACGVLLLVCPLQARAQEAETGSISGVDITRPLQRLELHTEFSEEGEEDKTTFTLRYDHPQRIGKDWRLNMRVEVPLLIVDSPEEGSETGIGDLQFQTVLVHDSGGDRAWGLGLQVRAPTGNERLGRGQWQFLPMAGHRWKLESLAPDSFFQFVARYRFSVGDDSERPNISELQMSPNLEVGLAKHTYISFFPSNDIRYNFRNDKLFVPVDIEVGKEWGRYIFSVEGAASVISSQQYEPYKWRVELRIGHRF